MKVTEITCGPTTFRDDLCHSLVDSIKLYLLIIKSCKELAYFLKI